jgi:hypothetical protein
VNIPDRVRHKFTPTVWYMGISTFNKIREIVMNPPADIDPVVLQLYREIVTKYEADKFKTACPNPLRDVDQWPASDLLPERFH